MLKAENICSSKGKTAILSNISFTLSPGKIMSVIGPSGAGKTSLLKAISLIDRPDAGTLTIDTNVYDFSVPETENSDRSSTYPMLTVVFQQLFIWPHLTIRQNLMLPLGGTTNDAHFDEIVNLFGMRNFLDRFPNEVSIGQRQRAALARALLLKPKYLLLDEVTSALDVEQSHLILSHLKQIAERGVGIIFVTHALHLAEKISDTVIFMDNGRIVESGTSHILQSPKNSRLQKFIDIAKQVI